MGFNPNQNAFESGVFKAQRRATRNGDARTDDNLEAKVSSVFGKLLEKCNEIAQGRIERIDTHTQQHGEAQTAPALGTEIVGVMTILIDRLQAIGRDNPEARDDIFPLLAACTTLLLVGAHFAGAQNAVAAIGVTLEDSTTQTDGGKDNG